MFAATARTSGGLALVAAGAFACQDPSGRVTESVPDRATFPYVGQMLVSKCGTIDCHGTIARNLRIFGDEGLRYGASDRPCVPPETTPAEFQNDYDSVVGLEPEVMTQVVLDHGADPERLDLLAKPLGLDEHKGNVNGNVLIREGDDAYRCIASWLAGKTDEAACLGSMPKKICSVPTAALFDAGAD